MKPMDQKQLKWELTRERLHIEDRFPPPERRTERHIGEILTGILQDNPAEVATLPALLAERWPVVAGEQLAQHSAPAHLKNGILYLYADHPGWLAELRRLPKARLLKKIASIPGVPEVTDLRFQLDPAIRTVFRK
jgi:predicted nucleic acid-binding Zn ribbon protein